VSAAGYSGKPLAQKLGIKPGTQVVAAGAPDDYEALLGLLPDGAAVLRRTPGKLGSGAEIVHLFCPDRAALAAAAPKALAALGPGGALWVSWPKKASALYRDLTEEGVRELLLPTGWVDVKVCAVDADWSGLKFLRRKAGA
jgi:hypothetical protein